jgi:hypothetical protein
MEQHLTSPTARKAHIFLDAGQWLRLREAYEAGHSVNYLSEKFRISRQTIDTRRKRERWMRKGPDGLVLLEPSPELAEPASDLQMAAKTAADRAVLAFNVGDTGAARDLATLASLLLRTAQQTQQLAKPARSGEPAERVFTPSRDIYDLLKERLNLDEDGNPVR